ncbi:AzlC family ABC transporter permease [Brevibacillus choshinensis]|uniref:AzlC family ABC transporter permease n=1 Tax=Brevibacillus choshinensis TaxID=54911 RepID=UPI002E1FAF8E|nr:AzlC family ABC transporter permease [Brevibacillus choshinensis]
MKWSAQSKASFRRGIWDSLPITASYILVGAIFGMMSGQAGLSPWQSVAMSAFVYSGAAQFSAIAMFADHASMWAIVLTTCMLNTRHLLMGLSISPYYQRFSSAQVNGLAYFLTDEQYAISLNRFRQQPSEASYIVAVGGSFLASWILGTWLGTVAGQWIPDPASLGLDFSFTAMFVALAFYQLTSFTRTLTFLLCGGLAVIFALLLPNGLHLLVAGLVAFMIGYVWPTKGTEKKENPNSEQKVETA